MKVFYFLWLLLHFGLYAHAQDKLVLVASTDTLLVKVLYVGNDYIKYAIWDSKNQLPIVYSNTSEVKKIVFENGMQVNLRGEGFDGELAIKNQSRVAVKIAPFSLFRNMLSVQCEYAILPKISAECSFTFVAFANLRELPVPANFKSGNVFRFGLKFIDYSPVFGNKLGSKHILEGYYLKPELVLLQLKRKNVYGYYFDEINGVAAMLNFGKQWVINEKMVIDGYVGVGLGKKNYDNNYRYYDDSFFIYGFENTGYIGFASLTKENNNLALALQTGFKIGFLIGK